MGACMLSIKDIRLDASIGFHQHETSKKQAVEVSVSISLVPGYLSQVNDDELSSSYDYDLAYTVIKNAVKAKHYNLLETLGKEIGSQIACSDKRIQAVKVLIKKPDAYDNGYSECEIVFGEWNGTN